MFFCVFMFRLELSPLDHNLVEIAITPCNFSPLAVIPGSIELLENSLTVLVVLYLSYLCAQVLESDK